MRTTVTMRGRGLYWSRAATTALRSFKALCESISLRYVHRVIATSDAILVTREISSKKITGVAVVKIGYGCTHSSCQDDSRVWFVLALCGRNRGGLHTMHHVHALASRAGASFVQLAATAGVIDYYRSKLHYTLSFDGDEDADVARELEKHKAHIPPPVSVIVSMHDAGLPYGAVTGVKECARGKVDLKSMYACMGHGYVMTFVLGQTHDESHYDP